MSTISVKSFEVVLNSTGYKFEVDPFLEHFSVNDSEITCNACDYQGVSVKAAVTHFLRNHKGCQLKLFVCSTCSVKLSVESNIIRHVQTVHCNIKPFQCYHCAYRAFDISTLRYHIKTQHLRLKKHSCKYCSLKFAIPYSLRHHMLNIHGVGTKKFKCVVCSKAFSTQTKLNCHEKIHSNIKNFKCELCSFASIQKGALKRHVDYVHLKLKLFKCTECNYRGRDRYDLKQHVMYKHENKLLKCSKCSYSVKFLVSIYKHLSVLCWYHSNFLVYLYFMRQFD